MTISRSLLAKAFPNDPRLRAEFEAAADLVDAVEEQATALQSQLDAIAQQLGTGSFQAASDLLTSIAALQNLAGAIEVDGTGAALVRPIDGSDQASLLSRGAAYTVLLALGGRGASSSRPTVPADAAVIYFDTTLNKPVFNYHGLGWVDSSGTAV